MKTPLDKKTYIKLAKAYSKQEIYEDKVRESIKAIAVEQGVYPNFVGLPVLTDLVMDTVANILGDEFAFFSYDCGRSFEEYNSRVTLNDGSHPKARDFGDLWELENKLYEEAQ